MRRYRIGLKLWSTNERYFEPAAKLYERGIFDYVELMAVPGSAARFAGLWQGLGAPVVIHAPHFALGLNLSQAGRFEENRTLAADAFALADALGAPHIIFHPGVNGDLKETVRQLKILANSRILIENKPYWGLNRESCLGHSPDQIAFITGQTGCGFCLDIPHAVYAANALGFDPLEFAAGFLGLGPKLFHLSDGDYSARIDRHVHYGWGNFPLRRLLALLPEGASVSIETEKSSPSDLTDFEGDVSYLRDLAAGL